MKNLLVVLAILSFTGIAYGAGIPTAVDPQNGPEVWTQEVFNDSGSTLSSGTVVIWDYTDTDMSAISSRKMYVTTTTTVDDIAVAGVIVDDSLINQEVGTIAIYGPVKVRSTMSGGSGTCTAGAGVGTSATAGKIGLYANTGADDATLGFSIVATSDPTLGGGNDLPIIFVNPSLQLD